MRSAFVAPLIALAVAACADRSHLEPEAPAVLTSAAAAEPLFAQDEELIGGDIYGVTNFWDTTTTGLRSLFRVELLDSAGTYVSSMYYRHAAGDRKYGWYTIHGPDCQLAEQHDTNGDTQVTAADGPIETHCIPNGRYIVELWGRSWNSDGTASANAPATPLARRTVTMVGDRGDPGENTTGVFHDQFVILDLDPDATNSATGSLRAADFYRPAMVAPESIYAPDTLFTIAAGDSLWLVSTFVSLGSDNRPWYGEVRAVSTEINANYDEFPTAFGSGVNSVPHGQNPTHPLLHTFAPATSRTFRVVGRTVEADQSGLDSDRGTIQLNASLWVSVVAPTSCFSTSGTPAPGQSLTFDAGCSTALGTREFRWNFGDGTVTSWSTSTTATHAFSSGSWTVTLEVRRATSTTPVVTSQQGITVAASLVAGISGSDLITSSGTWTWVRQASGGAAPLTWQWYYRYGVTEQLVGTDTAYARYVNVEPAHIFRLRLVGTDAGGAKDTVILFVDAFDPGGALAAGGGAGIRAAPTAVCRPRPGGAQERQAFYARVVAEGGWPEPCVLSGRTVDD